jgi:protein-tyrosine phosphatase
VTRTLLLRSDLILVMEKSHLAAIGRSAPEVSGKAFLLGKWQADTEIPDPYGQSRASFDHVFQLIDKGVSGWLPYLNVSEIQSRA